MKSNRGRNIDEIINYWHYYYNQPKCQKAQKKSFWPWMTFEVKGQAFTIKYAS